MHDSNFALDIDIVVLDTELSPDENHGCCLRGKFALRVAVQEAPVLKVLSEAAPLALLNTTAAAPPLLSARLPRVVTELSPTPPTSPRAQQGMPCLRVPRSTAIGASAGTHHADVAASTSIPRLASGVLGRPGRGSHDAAQWENFFFTARTDRQPDRPLLLPDSLLLRNGAILAHTFREYIRLLWVRKSGAL